MHFEHTFFSNLILFFIILLVTTAACDTVLEDNRGTIYRIHQNLLHVGIRSMQAHIDIRFLFIERTSRIKEKTKSIYLRMQPMINWRIIC